MKNTNKNNQFTEHEDSLFMRMIDKYGAYWPLYLGIVILMMLLAFIYLNYATPMYEATAIIMVKDEKKGSEDSRMMEAFTGLGSKKLIENEMEVIQSERVLEKVVRKLNLSCKFYSINNLQNELLFKNAPFVIDIPYPDEITKSATLNISYNKSMNQVIFSDKIAMTPDKLMITPYGRFKIQLDTILLNNKPNRKYRIRFTTLNEAKHELLSRLNVSFSNKQSSIIRLTYRDESPDCAKEILHQIIESYHETVSEEKNQLATKTIELIDERLNAEAKNIDSIERAIEDYKTKYNAINIAAQSEAYLSGVRSNNEELVKLNMQMAVADQLTQALDQSGGNDRFMMMSTMGVNDPNLQKLMTDLNNKELEYERLRKTVPDNNPMLLSLKQQIDRIKPDIKSNINSMRKNLSAGRDHVITNNSQFQSLLSGLPEKERKVLELSRDQAVHHEMYAFLLRKKEETALSYASTLTPFQLINDATSSFRKVSPNTLLTYSTALLLAIVLSTSIVYSREHLNPRILFRDDLTNLTEIPVIGEISNQTKQNPGVIDFSKRSFEAEEFRMIRLALRNRHPNKSLKKILITSGIPGEGKSYVAWNMALCMAASGQKVLIIDADIYQSGLIKRLPELANEPGFVEVIRKNKSIQDSVIESESIAGISILPAGKMKVDSFDDLIGQPLQELLKWSEAHFDITIIDTPPALMLTDAHAISESCDAVLYVVRHNHTPKHLLRRLDSLLENHPLQNPFIVFNGLKKRGFAAYGSGYGYYQSAYMSNYGYG